MASDKKVIMYDSDEAAQPVDPPGLWRSSRGNLFISEHSARYDGSTHTRCVCGEAKEKHYTACEACRSRIKLVQYLALPFQEWDGETPLYDDASDQYFFSEDSLLDWLEDVNADDEERNPADLRLLICEPQYAPEIEVDDLWSDYLDTEGDASVKDIDPVLWGMIEGVNKYIREKKVLLSWIAGSVRTALVLTKDEE